MPAGSSNQANARRPLSKEHWATVTTRQLSISRGVVLLSILAVACMPSSAGRRVQSAPIAFLAVLNEAQTDISPTGVTINTCALILPDGRFHIERRVQQLPSHSAALKVFDSTLDSVQFRGLHEILNQENIKRLPPFVWSAPQVTVTTLRGFKARIARGELVQSVGYVVWQGRTPKGSSGPAPSDIKKSWEQSEAALQPLLQWFQALENSLKLEPSDGKSTLCIADSDQ